MRGRVVRRLLHNFRMPISGRGFNLEKANQQPPSRAYVRTHLLFTKFRDSQSQSTPSFPFSSSSAPSSASMKKGLVNWYLGMIDARPIITKSLTAGFIFTAADLSSQSFTKTSSESFDFIRTLRMASYGMIISGPSLHLWFNFMSKVFPKRDIISTLNKMFLGQVVYGPIITSVFFSSNAALQGESGAEIVARLKRDLFPTFKSGLAYWPMCDFVTFKFVPVRLQPLVSNSFSFLWTIYITYMASLGKASVSKISTD